ncbi:prephenate dehydratase [Adhaeribacter aquaticus]|uniref:prephenate dehydratase n=1 Tax=Adhaeribacter aquaticus TaxID=299567 RepID=UPI000413C0C2|nr:prephenate dehydratase [Adhaeribacter aquaticus]
MNPNLKIAIQGGPASFHDVVAQQYFAPQTIDIIPCMTFQRVFALVKNGEADFGVIAIENYLAGSILGNYTLLHDYPVSIVGEAYLPIEQNLLALPGQTLEDIRIVRSHPMALLQCTNFLEEHSYMQAIESADTAESAREIRENNLSGVAAIASRAAAALYGLDIVEECIENYKENYTRFMVISGKPLKDVSGANKASVNFQLHHRAGELANILDVFRELHINLSLIQSIPIISDPNEFTILLDLEWEDYNEFTAAIEKIRPMVVEIKILGIYKRGVK